MGLTSSGRACAPHDTTPRTGPVVSVLSTAVYAAQFNVIARCWLRTECLRCMRCPRGPPGFIEICTISAGIVFSDSSQPEEGCAFSSNVFYMNHRRTGEVVRVGEPGDQLHPRWLGFKGARDRSLWRRRRAPPIGNTGAERLGDKGPWAGRDNPVPRVMSCCPGPPGECLTSARCVGGSAGLLLSP